MHSLAFWTSKKCKGFGLYIFETVVLLLVLLNLALNLCLDTEKTHYSFVKKKMKKMKREMAASASIQEVKNVHCTLFCLVNIKLKVFVSTVPLCDQKLCLVFL